jgi:urease gamma subunit
MKKRVYGVRRRNRRTQTVNERVVYAISVSIQDKCRGAKTPTELRKRLETVVNDNEFWNVTKKVASLVTEIKKHLGDIDLY